MNQLCYQPSPAGLVACADPCSVLAVEILVEQDVVAPVWIVLESVGPAEDRTFSFGILKEDVYQPARDFRRHFTESGVAAGSRRILDFVLIAEKVMELLE